MARRVQPDWSATQKHLRIGSVTVDVLGWAAMVSLVYHRPHCFALGKIVTITADCCTGPREPDSAFPGKCIREVSCFYMKAKVKSGVVLRNPLAEPRADGCFEPVDPETCDGPAQSD